MDIHECEQIAKDRGFDTLKFVLLNDNGVPIPCRWLDAYMGMFVIDIEGEDKNFIMSSQVDEFAPNHQCIIIDSDSSIGQLTANGVEWGDEDES